MCTESKMVSTVVIHETGGPEVLRFEHSTAQAPGVGEVWLEQKAIGLNPLDLSQRSGAVLVPLPCGLGLEGAGQVTAIGPGVGPPIDQGTQHHGQQRQ
jgi:NADPH2:quinone reductase